MGEGLKRAFAAAKATRNQDLIGQGIKAVSASLMEFGYPDAKPELIAKYFDIWKSGRTEEDIIFGFAARQFEEYPSIFGAPAAKP